MRIRAVKLTYTEKSRITQKVWHWMGQKHMEESDPKNMFNARITLRGEYGSNVIKIGQEIAFIRHFFDYRMKMRSVAEFTDYKGIVWQFDLDTHEVRHCDAEHGWFWTEWKERRKSVHENNCKNDG